MQCAFNKRNIVTCVLQWTKMDERSNLPQKLLSYSITQNLNFIIFNINKSIARVLIDYSYLKSNKSTDSTKHIYSHLKSNIFCDTLFNLMSTGIWCHCFNFNSSSLNLPNCLSSGSSVFVLSNLKIPSRKLCKTDRQVCPNAKLKL